MYRANLGACKDDCKKRESCNAIVVKDAISQIICSLKACRSPVPAPIGPRCEVPVNECGGYYQATGKKAYIHLEHGLIHNLAYYVQIFVENNSSFCL